MNVSKVSFKDNSLWIEGSEGGWNARQNYCDLYEVSGYIVGMNPLNQKPMFIVKDRAEVIRMARSKWPGAAIE